MIVYVMTVLLIQSGPYPSSRAFSQVYKTKISCQKSKKDTKLVFEKDFKIIIYCTETEIK